MILAHIALSSVILYACLTNVQTFPLHTNPA